MNKLLFAALLVCCSYAQSFGQNYTITDHGFRFLNHTKKAGAKPTPSSNVDVHIAAFVGSQLMQDTRATSPDGYNLTMPSDAQLKSSPKVPAVFDAILLMTKGDSATIFMALDSMMKSTLPPNLQTESDVRYEVVLIGFVSAEEAMAARLKMQEREAVVAAEMKETAANYTQGKIADKLTSTPSGLKMLVKDAGKGAPIVQGEQVKTHYYGALTDGKEFDNSFKRGDPLPFAAGVGQMIPGFDEGVMNLRHGAKAYLFIPSKLGYGENGTGGIPANSDLIFYIEIQ